MSTPATPLSTIQDAVTGADVDGQLLAVAGVGMGIGIVLLVVRRGWGFFRGFSR